MPFLSFSFSRSLHFALHRRTTPPPREPVIPAPQLLHHSRNPCQPNQGPRPPYLPSHGKHRICPAELTPVRKQKPQLVQQLRPRQSQQRTHPRILQRCHRQPAPRQYRQQPSRRPRAKRALRIKKQPSPSVPPFPVSKLRCQRNHGLLHYSLPTIHYPLTTRALFSVPSVSDLSALCVKS